MKIKMQIESIKDTPFLKGTVHPKKKPLEFHTVKLNCLTL